MYADDAVICPACRAGVRHLLCTSSQYVAEHNNAMIIRCKGDTRFDFYLSVVISEVKYMLDCGQCCKLYADGDTLWTLYSHVS